MTSASSKKTPKKAAQHKVEPSEDPRFARDRAAATRDTPGRRDYLLKKDVILGGVRLEADGETKASLTDAQAKRLSEQGVV